MERASVERPALSTFGDRVDCEQGRPRAALGWIAVIPLPFREGLGVGSERSEQEGRAPPSAATHPQPLPKREGRSTSAFARYPCGPPPCLPSTQSPPQGERALSPPQGERVLSPPHPVPDIPAPLPPPRAWRTSIGRIKEEEDHHAQRPVARHRAADPASARRRRLSRLRRDVRRRRDDEIHRRRLPARAGVAAVVHARRRMAHPRLFDVLGHRARDRRMGRADRAMGTRRMAERPKSPIASAPNMPARAMPSRRRSRRAISRSSS